MSTTSEDRAVATMRAGATSLPVWPVAAYFGLTPLWWALGLLDMVLMPLAVAMGALLAARGNVRVPRGFALWLLFLVWMGCSIVMVDTPNHMVAFLYRAGIYVGATVLFLYVYNLSGQNVGRRVAGILTIHWLSVVAGGLAGIALLGSVVRTPTFYVLQAVSPGLVNVDFINHMVVRRFAQYNPDSYLGVAGRPSAPFLYANNWGNVYSLLLPVVIAYMLTLNRRGERRDRVVFWTLAVTIAISVVPASFTMNRGMLIGLGLAALYVSVRMAMRGNLLAVVVILGAAAIGGLAFQHLAGDRLETRLEGSGTETRGSLYQQSLDAVPESPIFGYGVPIASDNPDAPPVGTQGQFWMVLVSHGPVAIAAFISFFLLAWFRSRRLWDPVGLVTSTLCLVACVELGFYGVVPYGLPIMMTIAALALRGCTRPAIHRAPEEDPPERFGPAAPALPAVNGLSSDGAR
ncbi:hypothetical protein E8D34_17790 [Nocardioides sp. GY 10113]|uniref:O-antigen ligase family protein n=1 Tax=Nocardioides sp. GY 10113 TaxID=2569761 RepID=UPI0010A7DBCF|nr:hypothetical protein [Nocardioides sp. GY 10113]TIC81534.1 hypothetical protein E8D34_17790 [Nocardioides sp. GY 10113]